MPALLRERIEDVVLNRRPDSTERLLEIAADFAGDGAAKEVATEEWRYESESCLTVFGLGGIERFDNGHTMLIWSTAGQVDEIDARDRLVSSTVTEFGYAFGYGQRLERLYATP